MDVKGVSPQAPLLEISRPILNQDIFDKAYDSQFVDLSTKGRVIHYLSKWRRQPCRQVKRALSTALPFLSWIKTYKVKKEIVPDIFSGFTAGIMTIPQGMAYGMLAMLPPEYGLYTSFFPPLIYAFVGTSRHISFGTFAIVSLMVRTVVEKNVPIRPYSDYGNGSSSTTHTPTIQSHGFFDFCNLNNIGQGFNTGRDIEDIMEVAFCLTFMVGVFQIIFGLVQAGFVSVYLSDQLVVGLTTGAAFQVLSSQFSRLFGIHGLPSTTGAFALLKFYTCLLYNIIKANAVTTAISISSVLFMIVVKYGLEPKIKCRFKVPLPTELTVVIITTIVCYLAQLDTLHSVEIVGTIPTGLPAPKLPSFKHTANMATDAIVISIVIFSISVSMAKVFAKKHKYNINANQEWYASGTVHIVSSLFSCHCSGSSLSRAALQESQGGSSQLASIFSCFVILMVLLFMAPWFKHTPQCVLSAIIVVNLKTLLFRVTELPSLWRKSKIDFFIWIVTFVSVILFDVSYGLIVGVIFALLTVLFRSQWPDSICLGNVPGTEIYKGINAYGKAVEPLGVKIYRFDSPLYFANAALFKEQLYRKTNFNPLDVKNLQKTVRMQSFQRQRNSQNSNRIGNKAGARNSHGSISDENSNHDLYAVIIDCSSFPYMDLCGVETLRQVYEEYTAVGVVVIFCSVKVAVRQMFESCEFYETVPKSCIYLTIHDAVQALQRAEVCSMETDSSVVEL